MRNQGQVWFKEEMSMFESKRLSKTRTITLNGPMKKVFPLFGPIEEMKWADGWSPEIVFSNSGGVEKHLVFKTEPHHAHEETDYTWIVSRYEPERAHIEYTVFTNEHIRKFNRN